MAALRDDALRLGHRQARKRHVGDRDLHPERSADRISEPRAHAFERVLQPALLERHDVLVGLDPRHLHIQPGELGHVPGGK